MLGDVWKLAHNIQIENVEENNLPKICKHLDELVTTQSVTRRLSLRASSNLLGGTAKLYKQSLDKLYHDVIKLNEDFIHRRRRHCEPTSSSERADSMSESTIEVPEEMRRTAAEEFENTSFSPKRGRKTEYPIVNTTKRITMSTSTSENLLGNDANSNEEDIPDENADADHLDSEDMGTDSKSKDGSQEIDVEEPILEERNPENHHKEKGIQTSPILTSRNCTRRTRINSRGDQGFNRNLPFGYILIHDNYYSRIPRKIIFTSINSDINNLI
ncbi:hypothetical protein PYW08_008151 [Mythimna loreyi]|uniref:Uncharacterized protein n=1 Tax=Mythimna loreyi TaxID=667449 RepID=A0ACC2QB23_9NEOP|nr:hypothetical protein PYW08_008151 [Mythimna loreyi]